MITINYGGRLGNNMIQYSAAKLLSNKHKLKLVTPPINGDINFTELLLLSDNNEHKSYQQNSLIVDNNNFLSLLESDIIENRHYVFSDYFQFEEFFSNYGDEIKKLYKEDYEQKEGVFVHYRIGDIVNSKNMLPIDYYLDALNQIDVKGGYITSDTPDHPNVITISNQFNLDILNINPINTIDLGRKFNNIVLSEGTFSWWIGHLSNAKNIFFNKRTRFWHGEIFTNKQWNGLNYD
jgi:hypothetical protein